MTKANGLRGLGALFCVFLLVGGSQSHASEQRASEQRASEKHLPALNTEEPFYAQPTPFSSQTPRFYMVENGRVQTAEDFDRWLQSRGLTIIKTKQGLDVDLNITTNRSKTVQPEILAPVQTRVSDHFVSGIHTAPVWAGEKPTVTIVPFSP